jgi:hypothetical protein
MFNPAPAPASVVYMPSLETAASSVKVTLIVTPVHNDEEIEATITALGREGGCVPSPGSSGSVVGRGLLNCDAAASAGTWRHKQPAARMSLGGSATVPP